MPTDLGSALSVELLKLRRSLVPWVSLGAFTLAPLVGGFFTFVMLDPDRARSLGLLGSKAQVFGGTADWSGYLAITGQIVGVGGLMLFGLVMIWMFGREFSDRTAKDLLALPVSRGTIVAAKFLVAAAWCLALTAYLTAIALAVGVLLDLPGWSPGIAVEGLSTVLMTAALTAVVATAYGLAASVARGYLAAVGVMFATLLASQVVAAIGYGAWFPWSVPSLLAGAGGPDQPIPGVGGVATVLAVGLAAVAATTLWWERADHDR